MYLTLSPQKKQGCGSCKVQSDCPPKYFLNQTNECTGRTTNDTRTCDPCPNGCRAGLFLATDCGKQQTTQKCELCSTTCGEGYYKKAACTIWDDLKCAACNTTCPAGFYVNRSCTGQETSDVTQCASCSSILCPAGKFLNISACGCQSCIAACGAGFYEATRCTQSTDRVCKSCTRCSATSLGYGSFQVSACNATADTTCRECTQCKKPVGQEYKKQVCTSDYTTNIFQVGVASVLGILVTTSWMVFAHFVWAGQHL